MQRHWETLRSEGGTHSSVPEGTAAIVSCPSQHGLGYMSKAAIFLVSSFPSIKAGKAVRYPSHLRFCPCPDPRFQKACSLGAPRALYCFSSPKARELCFHHSAPQLWGTSIPFPLVYSAPVVAPPLPPCLVSGSGARCPRGAGEP